MAHTYTITGADGLTQWQGSAESATDALDQHARDISGYDTMAAYLAALDQGLDLTVTCDA